MQIIRENELADNSFVFAYSHALTLVKFIVITAFGVGLSANFNCIKYEQYNIAYDFQLVILMPVTGTIVLRRPC